MPTATVSRPVTLEEAAATLQGQLGSGYKVTRRGSDALAVSHGGLAFASVHVAQDDNATTFHVHGGGLIIGRIINEFGIARTVTSAIGEAFAPDGAA
jgi:hypothetical protein